MLFRDAVVFALAAPFMVLALPDERMTEEVAVLHRAVFERDFARPFLDEKAGRELGLRYIDGRGVKRNQTTACGLLFLAAGAAAMTARDQDAIDAGQHAFNEYCAGRFQSNEETEEFSRVLCGTMGPDAQIFQLEPGAWVEISPKGVIIDRPSGRMRHSLPSCGRQYVFARHISVDNVASQPPARHLIETLSWRSDKVEQGWRRTLEWLVMEIIDSRLEVRVAETLMREDGSQWPTPPIPTPYKGGALFAETPNGTIRWRFDTNPPRTGTIGR